MPSLFLTLMKRQYDIHSPDTFLSYQTFLFVFGVVATCLHFNNYRKFWPSPDFTPFSIFAQIYLKTKWYLLIVTGPTSHCFKIICLFNLLSNTSYVCNIIWMSINLFITNVRWLMFFVADAFPQGSFYTWMGSAVLAQKHNHNDNCHHNQTTEMGYESTYTLPRLTFLVVC